MKGPEEFKVCPPERKSLGAFDGIPSGGTFYGDPEINAFARALSKQLRIPIVPDPELDSCKPSDEPSDRRIA